MKVRVFANGPRDWGSVLGRVMPKTQKWYLMSSCLTFNIVRYGSRISGGKGVAPSLTPWCSSYWKGNLRVALDYGQPSTYLIDRWDPNWPYNSRSKWTAINSYFWLQNFNAVEFGDKWYLITALIMNNIINSEICTHTHTYMCIYIYIYIYIFQTFSFGHLKLSKTLENSLCYCYTSYEMTDQFSWFQVQMNSYSSNWNTPY